jgi:hypothetical protein
MKVIFVKELAYGVDHFPPPKAEVKNVWSWAFTLPYFFMA